MSSETLRVLACFHYILRCSKQQFKSRDIFLACCTATLNKVFFHEITINKLQKSNKNGINIPCGINSILE